VAFFVFVGGIGGKSRSLARKRRGFGMTRVGVGAEGVRWLVELDAQKRRQSHRTPKVGPTMSGPLHKKRRPPRKTVRDGQKAPASEGGRYKGKRGHLKVASTLG